jgi:hypothetical protein
MALPANHPGVEIFNPVNLVSPLSHSSLPTAKRLKTVFRPSAIKLAGKLDLADIQKIVVDSGQKKPMKLTSGLHFDATHLVVGNATMRIDRSSIDPTINAILFDMNQGGGVEIDFTTTNAAKRYLIDATVSVLQSPKISSSIDSVSEQRTINTQMKHLCWVVDAPVGNHRFELWTSTPAFVIVQGIDITEME